MNRAVKFVVPDPWQLERGETKRQQRFHSKGGVWIDSSNENKEEEEKIRLLNVAYYFLRV